LTVLFKGVVLAAMLLGLGALAACLGEPDSSGSQGAKVLGDVPDVRLQRARFTEVKDGVVEWHLSAARVEYEQGSGLGRLWEVEVTFYPTKGQPILIRSERGTFDSKAKDIRFLGNVRGTADPYRLYSESLHYLAGRRLLETQEAARLESADLQVAGVGLHYDLRSRELSVGNSVRALTQQRLF
jgi:LPS export ABC transporter protein LptC